MSQENVKRFYAELERNPELHNEALQIQTKCERQEDVIDAFLTLAREHGFPFTEHEFIAYIYENGEEVSDRP